MTDDRFIKIDIDAEVFGKLCSCGCGRHFHSPQQRTASRFPERPGGANGTVGTMIAGRAVAQRCNIVTELNGADDDAAVELIEAMRAIGYKISVNGVNCDVEEAQRHHLARVTTVSPATLQKSTSGSS